MSALLHQARESSAKVRDGVIKFLAMTRQGPQAILAVLSRGSTQSGQKFCAEAPCASPLNRSEVTNRIPGLFFFATLHIMNKARQNRILPSVTSKTCRASFPVRAERGEFPRKNHSCLYYPPRKEGKPQRSGLGFPLTRQTKKRAPIEFYNSFVTLARFFV